MNGNHVEAEVSVVIPAYNEAENLPVLTAEIEEVLGRLGAAFEIIIVNDGSTDATAEVLEDLARARPSVRPLHFERNRGQTAALDAGIRAALGRRIVLLDADGQNDPADIPKLLDQLERFDVAAGWRVNRRDPRTKRLTSAFANRIRRWATGDDIHDTGCSLKAFRAETLRKMKLFNGMHRFLTTLAKMEGATVVEVKVGHRPRKYGKSKYNIFNRAIRPTLDLLAVVWMQRRALKYRLKDTRRPTE
ncbi:MAG: glycosyltransferase family 2 protein [Planctomycetota bacterium]|jgi:glycosyltransferase involved in cell wall biosynthesis